MDANSWEVLATTGTVPVPRHCHAMAVHANYIYVFGGYSDDVDRRGVHRNDLHKYSLDEGRWDFVYQGNKADRPPARHSHTMVCHNNGLYVFGGIGTNGQVRNDLHHFDIITGAWREIRSDNPPTPRWGHTANLHLKENGEASIVVFGGYGTHFLRDAHEFHIGSGIWRSLPAFGTPPAARQFHGAALFNHNLYIVGGLAATDNQGDCFRFNLDTYVWIRISSLPQKRRGHVTVAHNDRLYVHGGFNKEQYGDVCTLELDGTDKKWVTISESDARTPSARHFHCAIVHCKNMYIFGGYSKRQTNLNDLHRFNFEFSVTAAVPPPRSLAGDLRRLVNSEKFSDIVFLVEGRKVFAHKNILATRSEHFNALISNRMRESYQDTIEMSDVDHQVFLIVMEYLYTDYVVIDAEVAVETMIIGDRYLLPELKAMAER
ncbi:hypothetical protein PROFUN_12909, partial [Planoprotostelium fungivorum]